MNVTAVHVFFTPKYLPSAMSVIDVPGIGEIKISNAISDELREAIAKESEIALRQKMGLPHL